MDQVLMLNHKVQETQDHFHTSPKEKKIFFFSSLLSGEKVGGSLCSIYKWKKNLFLSIPVYGM